MARGGLTRQCHSVVFIPFGHSIASLYTYLSHVLPCSRFEHISLPGWWIETTTLSSIKLLKQGSCV